MKFKWYRLRILIVVIIIINIINVYGDQRTDTKKAYTYNLQKSPAYFVKFIKDYNKSYRNDYVLLLHYEAFKRSLETINNNNRNRKSRNDLILSINDLSDFTDEDLGSNQFSNSKNQHSRPSGAMFADYDDDHDDTKSVNWKLVKSLDNGLPSTFIRNEERTLDMLSNNLLQPTYPTLPVTRRIVSVYKNNYGNRITKIVTL